MNIPDFYKAGIMFFQEFFRNVRVRNMHDIVWFNNQWKFQGKPVILEQWAKSGILTLKDREMHGWVVSTVATDALVLKHQVISILNAD